MNSGIFQCTGSIFDSKAQALVNPVNCVGVMGKGLAANFKHRWPAMFEAYRRECLCGRVKLGDVLLWKVAEQDPAAGLRFIVNFPTKQHWRNASALTDVQDGLMSLIEAVRHEQITSIAIPALGCGEGGLAWQHVRPLIVLAFDALSHVRVELYGPGGGASPVPPK